MSDIFISYASKDRERVRVLVKALREQGFEIWWDRRMLPGELNFSKVITAALDELKTFRAKEGTALVAVLADQLDQIEILVEQAQADPSRTMDAIRERLAAQIKLLMESTQGFDEQRLTMEAALLATKADVREELDRLRGHIDAVRVLLGSVGPVGRKLDFLAQEFNREVNTLCSKSNAASITAIGLDLKAVVDQFREQVQNLE